MPQFADETLDETCASFASSAVFRSCDMYIPLHAISLARACALVQLLRKLHVHVICSLRRIAPFCLPWKRFAITQSSIFSLKLQVVLHCPQHFLEVVSRVRPASYM